MHATPHLLPATHPQDTSDSYELSVFVDTLKKIQAGEMPAEYSGKKKGGAPPGRPSVDMHAPAAAAK